MIISIDNIVQTMEYEKVSIDPKYSKNGITKDFYTGQAKYRIIAQSVWGEVVIEIFENGGGRLYVPDRTIAENLKHLLKLARGL